MEFKVVAVDVGGRPDGIPISKWIELGETYTVVSADVLSQQNGALGFKLKEIDLSDCAPYLYFGSQRFRPYLKADLEAENKVKELLNGRI